MASRGARWRLILRWGTTLFLVGVVFWHLDQARVGDVLKTISPLILVPVFLLAFVQVTVSAWRWRFTLSRLQISLSLPTAIREYYLATFLNQVLPGGVAGDANRAWRNSLDTGQRLAAVHGVAIERLSGQLVLLLVVAISLVGLVASGYMEVSASPVPNGNALILFPAGLALLVLVVWVCRKAGMRGVYFRRLGQHLHRTLWQWPAFPVQLLSSCLVLASYLAVFLILGASAGFISGALDSMLWAALGSLLLLSMVVPLTVAGWGVREGAAAILWPMAGLPAEQGVAVSVGYGMAVLVSSLPGLLVFMAKPGVRR